MNAEWRNLFSFALLVAKLLDLNPQETIEGECTGNETVVKISLTEMGVLC